MDDKEVIAKIKKLYSEQSSLQRWKYDEDGEMFSYLDEKDPEYSFPIFDRNLHDLIVELHNAFPVLLKYAELGLACEEKD